MVPRWFGNIELRRSLEYTAEVLAGDAKRTITVWGAPKRLDRQVRHAVTKTKQTDILLFLFELVGQLPRIDGDQIGAATRLGHGPEGTINRELPARRHWALSGPIHLERDQFPAVNQPLLLGTPPLTCVERCSVFSYFRLIWTGVHKLQPAAIAANDDPMQIWLYQAHNTAANGLVPEDFIEAFPVGLVRIRGGLAKRVPDRDAIQISTLALAMGDHVLHVVKRCPVPESIRPSATCESTASSLEILLVTEPAEFESICDGVLAAKTVEFALVKCHWFLLFFPNRPQGPRPPPKEILHPGDHDARRRRAGIMRGARVPTPQGGLRPAVAVDRQVALAGTAYLDGTQVLLKT